MILWPRRPFLFIFLLLFAVITNTATAANDQFEPLQPDITPHYHPRGELEAGLWLQLDKAEQDIKHSPKLITDPQLNQYVNDMVCRLASAYCHDIRVYIVRVPYFNAMMTPNGMMIVWSGLLLRVDNESQLAAVLGHEMGHYLRRHSLNNFIDRENKTSLSAFLTLGLAAMGVAPISNITDYMLSASIFANNREQEYEADKYGLQLLANAGYDVTQAAKIWDDVIAENKAAEEEKKDSGVPFFATHPAAEDRSARLTHYASQLVSTAPDQPLNQQRFVNVIASHWPTFLKDQLLLNQPKRSKYLLDSLIQKQKLLGTIHYFNGELARQQNSADSLQQAEKEYKQAIQYDDTPATVHRDLGLLFFKQKRFQEAQLQLSKYLTLVPDAKDREMIKFYISMEQH